MSTDPAILKAISSCIFTEGDTDPLSYFEIVTVKRGDRVKLCYLCLGRHALYLLRMNMKGLISSGTIEYDSIDKAVVDPANNSAMLLILTGMTEWEDNQVSIASDDRHSLLLRLVVAWQTHHMWKSNTLKYLPVVEYPLAPSLQVSSRMRVHPFKGFVRKEVGGYSIFLRESFQERPSDGSYLGTSREYNFVEGRGIVCRVRIEEPVPINWAKEEVDLKFLAVEERLRMIDHAETWFNVIQDKPYMKRMNLNEDLSEWSGWEFLSKTMTKASACVLLRRKYTPPLMDNRQDIIVTVHCPMKIMGKGRFTDEELLTECHIIADSITSMNEKSTVYCDMLQAKVDALMFNSEAYKWLNSRLDMRPSFAVHAKRLVAAVISLLQREGLLQDRKELLHSIDERLPMNLNVSDMIEDLHWTSVEGFANLLKSGGLGDDDAEYDAIRNAWYSRVSSYVTHCLNGGLLGSRLTLKLILESELRAPSVRESITCLLRFILHLRPRDVEKPYQASDVRHLSGENGSLINYTFNAHVMEGLNSQPEDLHLPVRRAEVEGGKKISEMTHTEEITVASSGSTTPGSADQPETQGKPLELLAATLLQLLRKEECVLLRAQVAAALTGIMSAEKIIKRPLAKAGLMRLAVELLDIKDDGLLLAALGLLECVVDESDRTKMLVARRSVLRPTVEIIKSNCDTKSKSTVVAHACHLLAGLCTDDATREECIATFPSLPDCVMRAFRNAASRSAEQTMCLHAVDRLCRGLGREGVLSVRDAVTGTLIRDLGELFTRLSVHDSISSAALTGADKQCEGIRNDLKDYLTSSLQVFDMLVGEGMEANCVYLKEKGLPHVLSAMRSKLPEGLSDLHARIAALDERIRAGASERSAASSRLMANG
ncbi:hypothetical protein FOZ62_029802 [Perkinsus olseni]|uniref:Uncharacterized protein n=1 Tax=Perkinsus olseni TaxID=32597 RepID=A0A7J6QYQ7_PEROL|nr:hypothetical protein FOZ62_029802 [Perkinsus olseni]